MTAITLTVTSFNGHAGDGSLSAQFDELGGLIGRADSNQLVLPDPERSISRVHAQVVYRNPGYALIDRGSNPITVNGRPAGANREIALRDGDRVQIGGYELRVSMAAAPAKASGGAAADADDPFADLLGAAPARPAGRAAAALPDPLKMAAPPRPADPFAAPRAGSSAASPSLDPFAAFGEPPAAGARAGATAGAIPDDWDPFGAEPPAAAGAARAGVAAARGGNALGLDTGAAAPEALIPGLPGAPAAGGDSLDALFGLKPGAGGDPFANSALDAPAAQPNMAGHADPLKALASAPRASSATQGDALSDLQRPFFGAPAAAPVPAPTFADSTAAASPSPTESAEKPALAAAGARLSWDDEPGDGMTVIRAPLAAAAAAAPAPLPRLAGEPAGQSGSAAPHALASAADSAATPPQPQAPGGEAPAGPGLPGWSLDLPSAAPRPAPSADPRLPAAAPRSAPPPAAPGPSASASAAGTTSAPPTADVQALSAAFRDGLDAPEVRFDGLTPELMRLIGELLREAAAGTVAMLQARAALKRELQAEMTMIAPRQNNPLKFSPSAEVALQHLLAPSTRGFMAAGAAMKDAYADLCAHQFGMVAGLRAALEGVLGRFDPAEIEGRLAQRSLLHSVLPASRKARLWELFVEHYGQIREEAADDFQTLFGKAFLRAYEEHIDQLEGPAT